MAPSAKKPALQKPKEAGVFEVWLRVKCAARDCGTSKGRNWFFVPAADLPAMLACPLCGNRQSSKELLTAGAEFSRRVRGHVDLD